MPVARFEKAVATIRALWDSGGEPVSRDSPYFPLRNAIFDLPPYKGKWPQMWIAAHGPRMLRITGRYADGWFPEGAFVTRKHGYAERLDAVRSAASDAGRDPMAITPAAAAFVLTGPSRHDVDEALETDAVKSAALLAPAQIWARHGVQHPLGANAAGAHDIIPQVLDEDTVLSYTAQVPASLMREITLNGTPAEVIDQAAEYRDQGARYLVIANIGVLQPNLRKAMASNLPFAKIIRGLKRL
jgi:phthiodiolone/phenolphthiodiolone dimycocerosates ketoreductase